MMHKILEQISKNIFEIHLESLLTFVLIGYIKLPNEIYLILNKWDFLLHQPEELFWVLPHHWIEITKDNKREGSE